MFAKESAALRRHKIFDFKKPDYILHACCKNYGRGDQYARSVRQRNAAVVVAAKIRRRRRQLLPFFAAGRKRGGQPACLANSKRRRPAAAGAGIYGRALNRAILPITADHTSPQSKRRTQSLQCVQTVCACLFLFFRRAIVLLPLLQNAGFLGFSAVFRCIFPRFLCAPRPHVRLP